MSASEMRREIVENLQGKFIEILDDPPGLLSFNFKFWQRLINRLNFQYVSKTASLLSFHLSRRALPSGK